MGCSLWLDSTRPSMRGIVALTRPFSIKATCWQRLMRSNHRTPRINSKQIPHLNTATLLNKTPHSQSSPPPPLSAPDKISVAGKSGSSTDFSCTWNKKRKNDSEDVSNAYGSRASVGDGLCTASFAFAFSPSLFPAANHAPLRSPHTAGANPTAVSPVDRRTRFCAPSHRRHLTTTSLAHQKLATLSSKRPRLKGKIREMGSRMAEGLSHGRNRKARVNTVVNASRMKSVRLSRMCQHCRARYKGEAYPSRRPRKRHFPKRYDPTAGA
jgi:hypothetical protein